MPEAGDIFKRVRMFDGATWQESSDDAGGQPECTAPTFQEYSRGWLAELRPSLARGYLSQIELYLNGHLLPRFGHRRVNEIHRVDMERLMADLLEQPDVAPGVLAGSLIKPRPVSRKSAEAIVQRMEAILKEAASEFGFVPLAPMDDLYEDESQPQPFTPEQARLVVWAAPADLTNAIVVRLLTGLHAREMLALKWCHLDMDAREIRVVEAVHDQQVTSLRGRLRRKVPMPAAVRQALHLQRAVVPPGCEFVFPSPSGEIQRFSIGQRAFTRMLWRAKLGQRHIVNLRHTAAMFWRACGDDAQAVAYKLGCDLELAQRRYVAAGSAEDADSFAKLDADVASALEHGSIKELAHDPRRVVTGPLIVPRPPSRRSGQKTSPQRRKNIPAPYASMVEWAADWTRDHGLELPPCKGETKQLRNWFAARVSSFRAGRMSQKELARLLLIGIDPSKYRLYMDDIDDEPVAAMRKWYRQQRTYDLDERAPEWLLLWQSSILSVLASRGRSERLVALERELPGLSLTRWAAPNERHADTQEWWDWACRFRAQAQYTPAAGGRLHPDTPVDLAEWARQQQQRMKLHEEELLQAAAEREVHSLADWARLAAEARAKAHIFAADKPVMVSGLRSGLTRGQRGELLELGIVVPRYTRSDKKRHILSVLTLAGYETPGEPL